MKNTEILDLLFKNRIPFIDTKRLPIKPGIYAVYFHGETFPDAELNIEKDDLVYLGKIESGEQAWDSYDHFKSGKTGSSLLRRTIGSVLREEFELIPIPRNAKEFKKGKTTYFKFIEASEGILSSWMIKNLSLSFYEYSKSPQAIDFLETELVKVAKPMFNITKYPNNPFGEYLKNQRKSCGELAFSQPTESIEKSASKSSHVYIPTRSEEGYSPRSFVESKDEKSNSGS